MTARPVRQAATSVGSRLVATSVGSRLVVVPVTAVLSVLSVLTVSAAAIGALPMTAPAATAATAATAVTTSVTPATSATPAMSAMSAQATRSDWSMMSRFARERVRFGDQDTSTSHIEHVRELQYRLHWAHVYKGPVTGYFGTRTRHAVKHFQAKVGLKRTGVANHHTWAKLIPRTVRGKKQVPHRCKRDGWHACYDRWRHQVTLWHRGTLWNSWLVRGGDRGMVTRVGHYRVFWRDKDHVSSLDGVSPMPYSQFFSGGEAFHGSSYMMDPFEGHSHGCINMYVEDARQLWNLTVPRHLNVSVYGHWD